MDDSVRDLHYEGEHYATLRSTGENGGMPDEHLTPAGEDVGRVGSLQENDEGDEGS